MEIFEKRLKTQKDIKEYFQDKIKRIGVCDSIKTEYPNDYEEFLLLFKRHPDYPEKINGIIDLKLIINPLYKCQSLLMVKLDNTLEDISYLKCVTQAAKDKLKIAMRNSIVPQIYKFRESANLICTNCGSLDNLQVDHIVHFEKLYLDFIDERNNLPKSFDTNIGYTSIFKKEDILFETEWSNYHNINAKLQILCKRCNCSREKFKKDSID